MVTSPSQFYVTDAFLRPQEFYESSFENIKGQHFSLDEYINTYADHTGNFTYHTDWSGFNIPGDVFDDWLDTFRTIRINEKMLLDALNKAGLPAAEKYYIIGCQKDRADVMEHEIAHALYYLNPAYKEEMISLTHQIISPRLYGQIHDFLVGQSYNKDVVPDEIQAYLSTSTHKYLWDRWEIDFSDHILDNFSAVFHKFYKQLDFK